MSQELPAHEIVRSMLACGMQNVSCSIWLAYTSRAEQRLPFVRESRTSLRCVTVQAVAEAGEADEGVRGPYADDQWAERPGSWCVLGQEAGKAAEVPPHPDRRAPECCVRIPHK